jgi:hypothetical protein
LKSQPVDIFEKSTNNKNLNIHFRVYVEDVEPGNIVLRVPNINLYYEGRTIKTQKKLTKYNHN